MGKKFFRFFELSYVLAKVNFKLRNEGTWLGNLWYLLAPLLMFLLLAAIFMTRLGSDIPNYPLYLLLGIIMFDFFQKTTTESTRIIKDNSGIIKSFSFPRESLVGSSVLANIFAHLFEIVILILFLVFFDVPVWTVIFYPFLIVFLAIFSFGFSLILSSLSLYFSDLDNLWIFLSRIIWFATPIFYAIGEQTRLFYLNLFNPMFYFIGVARDIVVYSRVPEMWMVFNMVLFSLVFLFVGLIIFRKLKGRFSELI